MPNNVTQHSVAFIVVIVGDGYCVFIAFIGASILHHLLMQNLYNFASVLAAAHTIKLVDTGTDTCIDNTARMTQGKIDSMMCIGQKFGSDIIVQLCTYIHTYLFMHSPKAVFHL